ncbi:peptidyl-prolyl cis-trans isomerase D [Loktanella sp. DSM 29012]|uniref:SurA N-terminal domain-containing protein n=1 Tax=Loktanella sp. DSM 29012 TaxID=1881056 RepID=UPI0008C209D7|nr:peptidyl-prolyl cis-trans isomerase [Loktanella sp. DSM 29012]SEQ70652.1 peptidyl-prolyl cis-trans isomerase D [Loktanella sp. DSM 29012]
MAKQKKSRFGVWVILILLFVGLLGFGTGGFTGSIQRLGMAGDTEISVSSYQSALNNQLRSLEAQVGNRVTFQQAQASGLDRQVLNQVVTIATLDNETARLGLSIGDDRVRDEVLSTQAFQSLSGNFDRETYRRALANAGMTEAEFEASLRADVARTLLQGAVISGVEMPPVYVDTLLTYLGETRDIVFAPVTVDDLDTPVPGPTEADLQTFYDENPDMFTAPEAREITYVMLTPAMLADDVTIPEDQVRNLYEDRISQFQQPERRLVERLVFPDAAAADAAQQQIAANETDFDALVTQRGLSLSDVDLGDVSRDDLGAAGDAVFAAAPDDVVGPIETSLGPALFRVNAILAAENIPFEDAAPDLEQELATAQARRVINQSAEQINDLIAGGATLEDLADRTELELGSISVTPDTTDGPAAYDSFRNAAAAVEEGAFTTLEELEDGGIFAVRLDSVTPPALQPMAEVSDRLDAAWRAAAERLAIIARAEELATQVMPMTRLDSLGLDPVEKQNLTRGSFVEGAPAGFMQEVFAMETSQVRALPTPDGALIVRLNRVTPADPDNERIAAQRDALSEQIAAGLAQDIYDAFANDVRMRTDVVIDQNAVNAVNSQMQ